jgi:hypothetical protein
MADETQPIKTIQNDRPVWGATAIGREIGLDRGQTYHLLNEGHLPARKLGRRWVSTSGQLRRALGADGSE